MINYTIGETRSQDTLQLGSETDIQTQQEDAGQHGVGESDDDDSELSTEDQHQLFK